MWTAQTLERRILRGLDEAMAGRPVAFRVRSAPSPDAPLVAMIDYLKGYPCFWLTPLAFYGEATDQINRHLAGRIYPHGLYKVEVKKVDVYGSGRTTVLHLWIGGSHTGEVFLIGEPHFDPSTNAFSVQNLDFDVKSQKALEIAAWLLHSSIRQSLAQATTVTLAAQLDELKTKIVAALNRQVNPHLSLKGKVDSVRLLGITSTTTSWRTLLALNGNVAASVN